MTDYNERKKLLESPALHNSEWVSAEWGAEHLARDLLDHIAQLEDLKTAVLSVIDGDSHRNLKGKHDKCSHDKYRWEECENCITDYLQSAIAKSASKEA